MPRGFIRLYAVLLVDDEPEFAATMARRLQRLHAVQVAHGVDQALQLLRTTPPQVVVVDVRLGGGGHAEQVRMGAPVTAKKQRWIALSGAASSEEVFHLASAGFHHFFEKTPEGLRRLEETLEREDLLDLPEPFDELCGIMAQGHRISSVQRRVQGAMTTAALTRSGGNLTHAGQMLGVSRQAIQWHMRKLQTPAPTPVPREPVPDAAPDDGPVVPPRRRS